MAGRFRIEIIGKAHNHDHVLGSIIESFVDHLRGRGFAADSVDCLIDPEGIDNFLPQTLADREAPESLVDLSELTTKQVEGLVEDMQDLKTLARLVEQELNGRGRKSVVKAITDRMDMVVEGDQEAADLEAEEAEDEE